jgi:hypothetical protein
MWGFLASLSSKFFFKDIRTIAVEGTATAGFPSGRALRKPRALMRHPQVAPQPSCQTPAPTHRALASLVASGASEPKRIAKATA